MARHTESSSSQFLDSDALSVDGSEDFTVALWFRNTQSASNQNAWSVVDTAKGNNRAFIQMRMASGDLSFLIEGDSGSPQSVQTVNAPSQDTWHHAAARYRVSDDQATVTLDADHANHGQSAVANPSGYTWDKEAVGMLRDSTPSSAADADFAELAVWKGTDGELTNADLDMLAAGFNPWMIVPEALVRYVPFFGNDDPEPDIFGNDMTVRNGPIAKAEHAPAFVVGGYGGVSQFGAQAAGGGLSIPVAMHSYRRRRVSA